ncbi:alpha/beta fold hydrolase [Kineobactrum salinum]|uniref:Alpha/beta hydrolase n=1 Tax=Kineobactrum salinum TaxID=2708301 RepID=A0A6C0TZE3_9GAMM|nr:alpha/beta fold hydrolase [Kineobactrum salinum]QIB65136.1 alpha/beta hydrolase [Kineobactrum salinum]
MSGAMQAAVALFVMLLMPATTVSGGNIEREDMFVDGEHGISLFIREVRADTAEGDAVPILLLHGARVPGVASFDLPVPNGSLAADLANAGHVVYIMDARGYGFSTRPPEMSEARDENPPLVRSPAVVKDIAAVVEFIRKRQSVERIALLGWATGGHWGGYYASLHPDRISHLVIYNSLYGGSDEHSLIGHGSGLEDSDRPGRFNTAAVGAYRFNAASSLFGSWDRSIPVEDKSAWRDPAVADAYAEAALASDDTAGTREPPSFRAPSGALEDSFYMATGRQLWDASLVDSRVLIIGTERDFWSRSADRETLAQHLVHAKEIRSVLIPEATHYVHLDRPERGRDRFIGEVTEFIGSE